MNLLQEANMLQNVTETIDSVREIQSRQKELAYLHRVRNHSYWSDAEFLHATKMIAEAITNTITELEGRMALGLIDEVVIPFPDGGHYVVRADKKGDTIFGAQAHTAMWDMIKANGFVNEHVTFAYKINFIIAYTDPK